MFLARIPRSLQLALAGAVLLVSQLSAGPISLGTWYEFSYELPGVPATGCQPNDPNGSFCGPSFGTPSEFLDAPPWTFSVGARGAFFTVTDAFLADSRFEIFNNGVSLGLTSAFTPGVDCLDDPQVCATTPGISSAKLTLTPGSYSITIVPTQGELGVGFLQVSNVPEPASVGLIAAGMAALTFAGSRRKKKEVRS
ncbi:MAG: PEP-CTERM sorting domain-containing protein [Bryobacteraceae bacterium]|nr:PEP-CTERM sorting domain-containing protein [Bryobacteraceae bacterium]